MHDYLKIKEAAKLLGVSDQTVRVWADRKKIKSWRTPGGHRLIHRSEIERLVGASDVDNTSRV